MNTVVSEAKPVVVSFTALDRCDRCGAQAYHRAEKEELSIILCNHHERDNRDKLLETGWTIISDETRPK